MKKKKKLIIGISVAAGLLVVCIFVAPILFPQLSVSNGTAETKMEQINSDGSTTIIEPIAVGDVEREDIEHLMDLQSQSEHYISEFDGVEYVAVAISKIESSDPLASVLVEMSEGRDLSNAQADDIRNYLTSSVENLQIDNITISTADGQLVQ